MTIGGGWLWWGCVGGVAWGQATTELLTTQLPYAAYEPVQDDHYLMRLGRLGMNLRASLRAEYTDNASLSASGKVGEGILGPLLTAGFFLPVSEYQKLQLDVGVGYDYYTARQSRYRLNILPNSHVHYAFGIGDMRVTLANISSTQSDATSRIELAGAGLNVIEFNQFNNDASVQVGYAASPRLSFSGGYSYRVNRTLTEFFSSLDRDVHTLSAGTTWQINYPIAVGMRASYSMFNHTEAVQNDGQTWSIGPTIVWRPSDYWTVRAGVSMTKSTFDASGTIQDTSDFSAPTFDFGVSYVMNKWMSHSLSAERSVSSGFGSNFTDQFSVTYGLQGQVGPKLSPVLRLTYFDAQASGLVGEAMSQYVVGLGLGYAFGQRLSSGFDYSYSIRNSGFLGRDYNAHRVSLQLNYHF